MCAPAWVVWPIVSPTTMGNCEHKYAHCTKQIVDSSFKNRPGNKLIRSLIHNSSFVISGKEDDCPAVELEQVGVSTRLSQLFVLLNTVCLLMLSKLKCAFIPAQNMVIR